MKILITCPPMLRLIEEFRPIFDEKKVEVYCPEVVQTLSEEELKELLPRYDGWIIGDDPATASVLAAGKSGVLKAAVKWGVGVDNVDFEAAKKLDLPIKNTPRMFGAEVADVAMGYVIALARQTFHIDREVRRGKWPKPCGISLKDKTVALVGFGDIGRNLAKRLLASEMNVIAYDPYYSKAKGLESITNSKWPERLEEADFIIFTCALTQESFHMLSASSLERVKPGVRIINVARGQLINQNDLVDALSSGCVSSAALDVFDTEPLAINDPLQAFEQCVLGSHNASNTVDAVMRASHEAISILFNFLGVK